MRLDQLKPAAGSRRPRKRVGRGISAGQGKTSGRGQKGQGSRSSVDIPTSFEGGQMPLAQRLPKLRGFYNFARKEFAVVNVGKLNRFEAGTEVNPQLLEEVGLVKGPRDGIKILAAGEIKVALKVSAHRVSAGARSAIEAAGGSVELLGPQPLSAEEREARARARAESEGARKAAAAAREEAAEKEAPKAKAEGKEQAEPSAEAAEETAAEAGDEPAAADETAAEPAAADAPEAEDAEESNTDEVDSPEGS